MTPEELLEAWEAEDRHPRPARAQELRPHIVEHTGIWLPHRKSQLEGFIDRFKGQVTRRLREAVEAAEKVEE